MGQEDVEAVNLEEALRIFALKIMMTVITNISLLF